METDNRAGISTKLNPFKRFAFWRKFSKFLFLGICLLFILAGVNVFNQDLGFAQAIECNPGEAVNTCHTLTGAGHTYCVFDENGNTESACVVESCFNGQNPPDCGGAAGQPATDQEFPCMSNPSLCGENTQFCENTGLGSAIIFKHEGVCNPSNGGRDANGCIFQFDNVRSFTGPNCQDATTPQPSASPAPAPATVTVCTGAVLTCDQLHNALRQANFPGPFDCSQAEIDGFNRAACPAEQPQPQAPACDPGQLNMSVTPNPSNIGNSVTFSLSGSQGSTWIGDSWSGGVDCAGAFWGSKTCTAVASGAFSWTHTWQNTAPNNFDIKSPQCSKTVSFSIQSPVVPSPLPSPIPTPSPSPIPTPIPTPSPSPAPVQIVCQPATQTVQINQFASLVSNNTGRAISWSAPNGNPSSGSGTGFSTRFAQTGTFNVTVSDGLTSSICQVTAQLAPAPTPSPVPTPVPTPAATQNITLGCPDGSTITVAAGQNVNMNTLCQSQQQQQTAIATGGQGGTATITFGNVGVGAAPQPVVVQPAVVQPVAAVVPQVAGVAVTTLPKTGLPLLAWSLLAFIPTGFGLRKFKHLKKEREDDPSFIWEDRKFKAGS